MLKSPGILKEWLSLWRNTQHFSQTSCNKSDAPKPPITATIAPRRCILNWPRLFHLCQRRRFWITPTGPSLSCGARRSISFVKVIRAVGYPAYKEVQFEDRLFTNDGSFLQRCRSLEAVDIDVENLGAQDMFRWAVKEQQERELDNANRKTRKPLAPLREVSLRVGSHCQIVNDIASVFGGTLSNLYICGGALSASHGFPSSCSRCLRMEVEAT